MTARYCFSSFNAHTNSVEVLLKFWLSKVWERVQDSGFLTGSRWCQYSCSSYTLSCEDTEKGSDTLGYRDVEVELSWASHSSLGYRNVGVELSWASHSSVSHVPQDEPTMSFRYQALENYIGESVAVIFKSNGRAYSLQAEVAGGGPCHGNEFPDFNGNAGIPGWVKSRSSVQLPETR